MRRDYSGDWRLDLERSTFELPVPSGSTFDCQFVISHCEPSFTIAVRNFSAGRTRSGVMRLITNFRWMPQNDGDMKGNARLGWMGDDLVLEIVPSDPSHFRERLHFASDLPDELLVLQELSLEETLARAFGGSFSHPCKLARCVRIASLASRYSGL